MDLSKDVYGQLLQQFEALRLPPPSGDTAELLPLPDIKVLDWAGSHLVANADEEDEKSEVQMEDLDWEDVAMAIGARIVRGVRDEVFRQLGYTCSAGIANCKMVAKLGSGFKKPNQQVSMWSIRISAPPNHTNSLLLPKVGRTHLCHPALPQPF